MSFDRLPAEDKANTAPVLLSGVSSLPTQHQDIILRIVCKAIGDCHSSKLDENIAVKYKAFVGKDRHLFVEFCLHTILYQPPSNSFVCPPGLSLAQSERVRGALPLHGDMLLRRKLGILNVCEAMQLEPELTYPLYLAASVDSQEHVIKRGEELVKHKSIGANLDNADLVNKLFLLFNGTTNIETIPAEFRTTPVSNAFRVRLMSVFCRSIGAANAFPSALQCIFGCIYGMGTTSRLKQLGMEFTVWVFRHASMDRLNLIGPVILTAMLRLLDDSSFDATDARSFAFQAIGLLASRMPQLFRDKVDMALRLFTALKFEDPSLRLTIQESLISLAIAYKGAPLAVLKEMEAILLQNCRDEQGELRFCSMRWATTLFGLDHCPSRYICMLGADDLKMDIRLIALEGLHLTKDQEQLLDDNVIKYPKLNEMDKDLLFPSRTYFAMVRFLMKCFKVDLSTCDPGTEFSSAVVTLCNVLEHAMAFEGSIELHAASMKALVEIGSHQPKLVASRYAGRLLWLKPFLGHVDFDTRESASRLLGITCAVLTSAEASALINELIIPITEKKMLRFENQHGILCSIGYVMANCMNNTLNIPETLFANVVDHLVSIVELESLVLSSVSLEALGHIGLCGSLPNIYRDEVPGGVLPFLNERIRKLLDGEDIKAIQRIVIALGHISVKETLISHLSIALDIIFGLSRTKVEDVLFAAGEALSFIWGGVPVTVDEILKSNYSSLSKSSNYLADEISFAARRWNSSQFNVDHESHSVARN
ncbi:hypothetical protein HPP92_022829 [Vanilla planifolia]|uniref:Uncharacterized protein n=1 Tax=Vanilla planifolia TaxID=51239 RepID=A0A835UDJ6_VANPL|nr:hypothetical protein HPP92_022829 [Vanilla planifolia]